MEPRGEFRVDAGKPQWGTPVTPSPPSAALLLGRIKLITLLMDQTPRGYPQSPHVLQHLLLSAVPQPARPP